MTQSKSRSLTTARYPTCQARSVEWVTMGLFFMCLLVWAVALFWVTNFAVWLAVPFIVFSLVLHGSLTHEVCHGHPLPSRRASEALVHINPGLAVPFLRFRDTHLAHHNDAVLTDPYDDPESNYLDPARWIEMPRWLQIVRLMNNTLAGRMVIGPILGQISFMASDWQAIRGGDMQVLRGWLWHIPGAVLVVWLVWVSPMSFAVYCLCAYIALSILKIRTFLEHQAHDHARGRTVIIEDQGVFAFLFLNNNLHVVHHMHPAVPWYQLPKLYWQNRDRYVSRNDGYVFRSYGAIFQRFFMRAKDPVPHPLWPSSKN